jgi:hypothetical protein
MTKLEKQYASMTPAQRKKATAAISDMMGMPKKRTSTKRGKKK